MKTLKKQFLILAVLFISVATFAQKEEMKAASKAVNKAKFSEALATLNKLDVATLDDKTKAKYLFLKSKALNGSGKITAAAETINELISFESKIGKSKYTNQVTPMLQNLLKGLGDKGTIAYQNKDWKLAKTALAQVYGLHKTDTAFLYYAALAAYNDKDFDTSLNNLESLIDVGYTGVETKYYATAVETNERFYFSGKKDFDLLSNTNLYKDPKTEVLKSKRGEIYNIIASIYSKKKDNDNAIIAINKAREVDPSDVNIILTAADLYYEMGDNKMFLSLMEEAIKYKPDNAIIYNNIGIINRTEGNNEKAKESFRKAMELAPEYKIAIINLADTELKREDAIVKEMEANINDFDKFDLLKAKQLDLYREVLPLYEKAYGIDDKEFDKDNEKRYLRTLMAIYENLEMYDKMKDVKTYFDGL